MADSTSNNTTTGGNARSPPPNNTPSTGVPQNQNAPRMRSAPPVVGEVSENPQGSMPTPARTASVPGYPSPFAAGFGAAPPPAYGANPPAGGTYGQVMFPPPMPPPIYSPHTYPQGTSAYPPQAHLPYATPPSTGYPPPTHVYAQHYPGHSPQLVFPGYGKPMPPNQHPGNPNYHAGGGGRIQPFNVEHPQMDGSGKYLPAFHEAKLRQGFIRKVMCLVLIQLAVTTAAAAAALGVDPVQEYLKDKMWVFWASWVGAIGLLIFGGCNYTMLRRHPHNMVFLGSLTLLFSAMVASIVAKYDSEVVMLAFIVTTALVLALVLLATRANFDITNWGGMLLAFLLVLMVTSIVGVFWVNSIFKIVISALGAVLFSIYLVFDVQMLMGDKKRALSPDDYVLGAITIYLDIINIFLYLLSLIGLAKNRGAAS